MPNQQLKLTQHFMQEEPRVAARKLEGMATEQASELFVKIPVSIAVDVLRVMEPRYAARLILSFDTERIVFVMDSMSLAEIAAILRFCQPQSQQQLMANLTRKRQAICALLLSYPEHTVGTLIETQVLVADSAMSVAEVELRIKKSPSMQEQRVFLVDQQRHLVGYLTLADLLRNAPEVQLSTLPAALLPVISGMTDLDTALGLECWQSTDTVCVCNLRGEFVGTLHHHALRTVMSRKRSAGKVRHSLVGEMLEGYVATLDWVVSLASEPARSRSSAPRRPRVSPGKAS